MSTAEEIYTAIVRDLPPIERLRLAALILKELTEPGAVWLDESDEWSEEDMRDLTAAFLRHAATL